MSQDTQTVPAAPPVPSRMLLRYAVVFSSMLVIMGGLHLYIGARVIGGTHASGIAKALGWALIALLFALIPGGFALSRNFEGPWISALEWIAHLWIGAFGILLTACVATDVLFALAAWLGLGRALPLGQPEAIALISAPAVAWAVYRARGPQKIERVRIPVANLAASLEGFKIAQITDVHIGQTLGAAFLRAVVDRVNALQPDMVAITGDLVDGSVSRVGPQLAALSDFKARDGVFYVTGNHEYYHGVRAWEAEVRRHGIVVLKNEHRVIDRVGAKIVVAGIPDLQARSMDPEGAPRPDVALAKAPAGAVKILLAHQPKAAPLAEGLGVDLQLSGHTHGGQIFPFNLFVRLQQPVVSGLRKINGVLVYTSRGTGYWGPPMRLGARPEITLLTLVKG